MLLIHIENTIKPKKHSRVSEEGELIKSRLDYTFGPINKKRLTFFNYLHKCKKNIKRLPTYWIDDQHNYGQPKTKKPDEETIQKIS